MEERTIRHLEELSVNAWPAPRQLTYDGWAIGLAGGYTRRANSVSPLREGDISVTEKISFCQKIYTAAGLPTRFKIANVRHTQDFLKTLRDLGYTPESGAAVQVAELGEAAHQPDSRVASASLDDWSNALVQLGEDRPENLPMLRAIVGGIALPVRLGLLIDEGQTVAAGMAVRQESWVGLFHIVTDVARRRRGYAMSIIRALLNWAQSEGAGHAYLQVVQENLPARRLYAKLGFTDAYEYIYWRSQKS